MAELFTEDELAQIRDRANAIAHEEEEDAGLRAALQLFAETAQNLIPKVRAARASE